MCKIKSLFKLLPILLFLAAISLTDLAAQGSYFKFPITKEGIYKISGAQAAELGASSIHELSLFGYPGMLPQQLDSSSFQLMEIPTKEINGELFFYLTSAPQIEISEDITYQSHHYTDTLHYLIQTKKPSSMKIPEHKEPRSGNPSESVLYQAVAYKNPQYNLLSSGRDWYGERMFDGETIVINYEEKVPSHFPLYYQGKVMAQSLSASSMEISFNHRHTESFNLPSVTNSTYGIKGQTAEKAGFVEEASINGDMQVQLHYKSADKNGSGYLDYLMLGFPVSSIGTGAGIYYNFNNKPFDLQIRPFHMAWDVSSFFEVKDISSADPLQSNAKKTAVFQPEDAQLLTEFEPVNLNLRLNPTATELIIITHPLLLSQATRLANHKNKTGTSCQVVTPQEIYAAFGYGNPDVTAIRNFLAYHYHHGKELKNVLLFGKGTYDYNNKLGGRPNLVPTYSSRNSLNPLTTYSSDDYFAFMELGEGNWEETAEGDHTLDIGVGRLPVINLQESRNVVDKIIQYSSPSAHFGDWKRKVLFVADDGDNNVHLNDSESLAGHLAKNHPQLILEKLYLDSFEQQGAGSNQNASYAKSFFETKMDSSVLLVNYIGHGNATTLMAEELFTVSDLSNWRENDRLPVFVTATCEFGRHDSPLIRSGAEELLVAEKRGAIALLTTGRPVFSNINFDLNQAFIQHAFHNENGKSLTLGEIIKLTKNNSLNGPLNRNFSLLGDPSLSLAVPELTVEIEPYFDVDQGIQVDTLRPLSQIRYQGKIMDPFTGATSTSFNGDFEVSVSDIPAAKQTLGNESNVAEFQEEGSIIHHGSGKVVNGYFEGDFFLPKSKDPAGREGTVRFYAKEEKTFDEAWAGAKIRLGGSAEPSFPDTEGPLIRLILERAGEGNSISSSTAWVTANLQDPSGILLNSPGQETGLSIQVNGGGKIALDDHYRAVAGSYTEGTMQFPIRGLKEGVNIITFEAHDNQGNSSYQIMEINVSDSRKIRILTHLVFPNPASIFSEFQLSHNREGENLLLGLKFILCPGAKIFSQSRRFPKADSVLDNVSWFFMQSKTEYPAKGTYLYVLELKSEADGSLDRKSGKILIQ